MRCEVSENRRLRHASVRHIAVDGRRPLARGRHETPPSPVRLSGEVQDYPPQGQERRNGSFFPRSGPIQAAGRADLRATQSTSCAASPPDASAPREARPISTRQRAERAVRQRRASRRSHGKTVSACRQARIRRCRRRATASAHDRSEALWQCILSARPEQFRSVRGTGLIGGWAGHGPGCGRMLGQLP